MAELESLDIKFVATSDDIPAELGANTLIFLREGEGGGTQITVGTITVSVADWSGGTTATKTITGLTANDDIVAYITSGNAEAISKGVEGVQDGGDIVFTADSTPIEDIVYKYHIYKGVNA